MAIKVLITGGSGFIGSNLLAHLKGLNEFEIKNFDVRPPTDAAYLKEWIQGSLLDLQALKQAIADFCPDFIFHLGARTDLNGANLEAYAVNDLGTANLISACEGLPSVKKIVFASSMLVCRVGYQPKFDTDYTANTLYGISKINMENLIRAASPSWQWAIVRPTSIWGPGFKEPYKDFFMMVLKNRFFDLGQKYSTKTYGYVGNTVYQLHRILLSPETDRKTYYLGDNPPISISAWGKEIARMAGLKQPRKLPFWLISLAANIGDVIKSIGIPFPMSSFRLKNMTTNNVLDLSTLYTVAPAPPFTPEQGIKETLDWIEHHEQLP